MVLVPFHKLKGNEEITFDYGEDVADKALDMSASPDPSDMGASFSLSDSSGDVYLTGEGTRTTALLYKRLQRRVIELNGREVNKMLGIKRKR